MKFTQLGKRIWGKVLRLSAPFIKNDRIYLSLYFKNRVGDGMDWDNPSTFNQKLTWLKTWSKDKNLSKFVDKYEVRDYIANTIGKQYLIPLIGVWDSVEDIDFSKLSREFVLKTTHDSGGIVISKWGGVKDVDLLKLKKCQSRNYVHVTREYPYAGAKPRIIAEEFIAGPDGEAPQDYKFFCFNGKPKFLKVDFDRFSNHGANYYDLNWNLLPFSEDICPRDPERIIPQPLHFAEMVEIAGKLAEGHAFIRVDLYNIQGKIYFGELTFFPASGMGTFTPREWDAKLGEMLDISQLLADSKKIN